MNTRESTHYRGAMRRLVASMTGARFFPCAVLMHFLVRAIGVWGRPAGRFPDSSGFESLSFFGENLRFWPVPLAYRIADTDGLRIALQVLAGTAAWTWLAVVLSRGSRFPRSVIVAVLLLGAVPQVTRWDLAILSESLGITLTVAAIAASVSLARRPSFSSRMVWLTAMVGCAFVRPTHLIVVIVCLVGTSWTLAVSRGRRGIFAMAVLVVIGAWGVNLQSGNTGMSVLNMYTVLMERIVTNDERWEWFVEQGMPDLPGMREATAYDFSGVLPDEVARIVELPPDQTPPSLMRVGGIELANWVRDKGWSTYARWVITHPDDTWERISSLTPAVADPPNDDFLPLENRVIVPRLLFQGWWLWALVLVAGTAAAHSRPTTRRAARAIAAMTITTLAIHSVGILASGIEHPRHGATAAVALRVLALCAAILALGGAPSGAADAHERRPSV